MKTAVELVEKVAFAARTKKVLVTSTASYKQKFLEKN